MREKLVWKSGDWNRGGFVGPVAGFPLCYAADLFDAVEWAAFEVKERRGGPSGSDVRHTLETIAARPGAAQVDRLDPLTEAALEGSAWKLYRTIRLKSLTQDQLPVAARRALELLRTPRGRSKSDDIALQLVRHLLASCGVAAPLRVQQQLIRDGLRAAGLGHGGETVDRIRLLAVGGIV